MASMGHCDYGNIEDDAAVKDGSHFFSSYEI